jgi:hypothetical protein
MLCVKKPHWMVSLITVTMTLLSTSLCLAQGQADPTDYIAELNKLGIAGRPESGNAAPYYQKAIELYVKKPTDLTISTRSWPKEQPMQQQAVLRKWVQDNNAALEQIQLGSQKSYCWFTQTDQKPQTEMPHLTPLKELAKALQARAMLQAEDGGVSGAVNDIVTLYRFGAHIAEGPKLIIEKLVGINVKSFAISAAFNILDEKMIAADLMKSLQNQLEQLCPKQNEPFDIRGEKIYMQGQIETDPNSLPFKPYLKSTLEYYDTMAAQTPWQLHNEQTQSITMRNPLIETTGAGIVRVVEIEYRSRADTQALITTLAILRYKSDKGMYPASLPELVPAGYIKELPTDPFSNNPLVYKQTRESFTLYSFGVDFDDDGGQPSKWGSGDEGGDQVFWPLEPTAGTQRQVAERKLPSGPEQEKLTKSLYQAIMARDIDRIKSIISKGADVNAKDRQGWTSLHTALWYGNNEMVELLISEGADVNARDDSGNTPLHFAAMKGNSDAANLLIEKGANINAKTNAEQTPLMFAADYGHKEIVELLISKGADVNAQARNDNALSLARRKNYIEIADLLLKHGAKEPTPIIADEGLYGRRGQTEGPARQPPVYQGFEGQAQPGSSLAVIPRTSEEILADANEIKARVKTYEGLAESLEEVESKSRLEKSAWAQRRIDNRTSLIRVVEEQVKLEMTFVRKIAAEEKAEKTTKTIDDVLLSRDNISGRVHKELLAQRRGARQGQQQDLSRGRGMARGRGTRGRNLQEGYQQGQQTEQEMIRREGGYGRRGEPDEGEQLDSETQNKISQWLQTTLDNKDTLMQFVYTDVRAQYALIQAVAAEEEAKKTTAAIDGILLNREKRFEDIVLRVEELAEREQQMQDGRGRNLRTTRGRAGQDWPQPGQGDESAPRSRRR